MTGNSVIKAALRLLGVIGEGETPSAPESADALEALNVLIDSWGIERLTMFQLLRTVVPLVSLQPTYTIGTGGDINIVRPDQIDYANLIIDTSADPVTEIELAVWTEQQWEAIAQKELTNPLAQGIFYDRGWTAGLGIIYPWPIPDVGTTSLVLYTKRAVTRFTDLVSTYTLPPGYERALRYNLAVEIAPEYDVVPTSQVTRTAMLSLGMVKRANITPVVATMDSALIPRGEYFDWRTGTIR